MSSLIMGKDSLLRVKKALSKKELVKKKRWSSFMCNFGVFTIVSIVSLIVLYISTRSINTINVWPIIILLIGMCEVYYLISDLRVVFKKKKYNKLTKIVDNSKLSYII